MTTQELEIQFLSLTPAERLRIAQLLTQSVPPTEPWKNINTLSTSTNTAAWNSALQQLQTPAPPQALAHLLQSWEDEGDTQEQQATWELLHQAVMPLSVM